MPEIFLLPFQKEHSEIAAKKKLRGECGLNWEDYKQMEFSQCVSFLNKLQYVKYCIWPLCSIKKKKILIRFSS